MKRSFYEMLEVPRDATQEQIDEAYAKLTERLGSSTSVRGTAETMSELNMLREGYGLLSNPEKRAVYDAKLYATEAGIELIFFPKDTKEVRKLGINTVVFAALACVFTYVIYQKFTHDANAVRVEQAQAQSPAQGKADKPKSAVVVPDMPKADVARAEAVNAEAARIEGSQSSAPPKAAEPAAAQPDGKAAAK